MLDILTANRIGYALWNFRGDFGILDSRREEVEYQDWYGHKLRGLSNPPHLKGRFHKLCGRKWLRKSWFKIVSAGFFSGPFSGRYWPERARAMDDLNFPGWRPERLIQVVEADGLTRVLMKGQLYMSWRSGDKACVRLAIVQLHQCGLATEPDLAEAFGRHVTTVQRYLRDFADEGMEGLVSERRGPKGRWKLTPELRGKILLIVLREGVWGLEVIQQRLMEAWHEAVSVPSIQRVLEDNGLGEPINQGGGGKEVQGELFGLQREQQLVLGLEGKGPQPGAELGASSGPPPDPMAEGSGGSEAGGQEVGMGARRNYSSAQRVYLDELEQGAYHTYAGGLLFAPLLARYNFLPTLRRVITIPTHEGYSLEELGLTLFYLDMFGFRWAHLDCTTILA